MPGKAWKEAGDLVLNLQFKTLLSISIGMLSGCQPGKPDPLPTVPDASASSSPSVVEPDGTRLYYQLVVGREVTPLLPAQGSSAAGWHYRVERSAGRISAYARINPAGRLVEQVSIDLSSNGLRTFTVKNGYGTLLHTETVNAAGIRSRTLRSGEVIVDGCYQKQSEYDAEGNIILEKCQDQSGRAVMDDAGCFVWKYTWAPERLKQSKACLQDDLTPIHDGHGVHRTVFQYDAKGRVTEEGFYATTGERIARGLDGCARLVYRRDAAGNATDTMCQNAGGNLQSVQGATYAIVHESYDQNGCVTERRYFADEQRAGTKGSLSVSRYRVDPYCGILHEEHRDAGDRLVMPGPGDPALEDTELGSDGLPVAKRCSGKNGPAPCRFPHQNGPSGSVVKHTYDDRGRLSRTRCYDPSDKPTPCAKSYPHERRFEYGADGRLSAVTFADNHGSSALGIGVARFEYTYNSLGKQVRFAFFDRSGKPMSSPTLGFAMLAIEYDAKNRLSAMELRDVGGELVKNADLIQGGVKWAAGSAKLVVERSPSGAIANVFYGPTGALVKRVDCTDAATPCHRR